MERQSNKRFLKSSYTLISIALRRNKNRASIQEKHGVIENTLSSPQVLSIGTLVAKELPTHLRPGVPQDHRGRGMVATKHSKMLSYRNESGYTIDYYYYWLLNWISLAWHSQIIRTLEFTLNYKQYLSNLLGLLLRTERSPLSNKNESS